MLSIALVLLFVSSALAAPAIEVNLNSINEIEPLPSNGRPIGAHLLLNALDILDGGEQTVNVHTFLNALGDVANLGDSASQARALAEGVSVLIELSSGVPGDSCAAAQFIESYVSAVRAGNRAAARAAACSYIRSLVSGINSIVQLASNPSAMRFASGRRGNCPGGGGNYQFEEAWELALSNAPSTDIIQEEYCSVKSLYNGFTAIARNLGAVATAAVQSHIVEAFRLARRPVTNFLEALGSGSPYIEQAARIAQQALINASNNIPY